MFLRGNIIQVSEVREPSLHEIVCLLHNRFRDVGASPIDATRLAIAVVAHDLWRTMILSAVDEEITERLQILDKIITAATNTLKAIQKRIWFVLYACAGIAAIWGVIGCIWLISMLISIFSVMSR